MPTSLQNEEIILMKAKIDEIDMNSNPNAIIYFKKQSKNKATVLLCQLSGRFLKKHIFNNFFFFKGKGNLSDYYL